MGLVTRRLQVQIRTVQADGTKNEVEATGTIPIKRKPFHQRVYQRRKKMVGRQYIGICASHSGYCTPKETEHDVTGVIILINSEPTYLPNATLWRT